MRDKGNRHSVFLPYHNLGVMKWMRKINFYLAIGTLAMIGVACEKPNPNVNLEGQDVLSANEVSETVRPGLLLYVDTLYVPIYSDIYTVIAQSTTPLAATLSIHNTSLRDSLYVDLIDYYNTNGVLVRKYVEGTLLLSPLQTIDYIIERADNAGGTGANFIVGLSAKQENMYPLIQAVMIGTSGQHGFAFTTDAVSIMKH